MHLVSPPPPPQEKNLHNHHFKFPLGSTVIPREIEDDVYAKFGGNKQGALWFMWKW